MHAIDRSKNQQKATDRKQNEYDITNLLSFIYSRYKTEKKLLLKHILVVRKLRGTQGITHTPA